MLPHVTAKRTARKWSVPGTALDTLARTGAIDANPDDACREEIGTALEWARASQQEGETLALIRLRAYVDRYGPRGPVPGWNRPTK